uniref:Uncharacterized protein n=1 Tax=Rhodnius prolixus TaxID=13249 RepID=T1IGD8_RHOPR
MAAARMKSRKQIDDRTQSMPIQSVVDVEARMKTRKQIDDRTQSMPIQSVVDVEARMKTRKQIDDRTQSMPIQSVVDVEARMKTRKQIDDRTQSMPIQSVVDVEAISSSTCIISTAPAAQMYWTPSLIRSAAFILLRFTAQLDSIIWCFIITIRFFLKNPFQSEIFFLLKSKVYQIPMGEMLEKY